MENKVLIKNFFPKDIFGESELKMNDLGWPETIKRDARSDYPETIFRYIVEIVGLNILFYWLKDRQWYAIETEKTPIEVRRIYPNPDWDGNYEWNKSGEGGAPSTCSKGNIIATFDDPTQLWDNLRIANIPIGQVLEEAYIADLD